MSIWVVLKSLERLHWREKFYSFLAGKKFSNKDYGHILKVWDRSVMKTIKDYHQRVVLLLVDVFDNFDILAEKFAGYAGFII